MKTSIVGNLKGVQASDMEMEYIGSQLLRRRLVELLMDKQTTMLKKRRGEGNYDSPNWALLQADAVGYERAISEVISLIS